VTFCHTCYSGARARLRPARVGPGRAPSERGAAHRGRHGPANVPYVALQYAETSAEKPNDSGGARSCALMCARVRRTPTCRPVCARPGRLASPAERRAAGAGPSPARGARARSVAGRRTCAVDPPPAPVSRSPGASNGSSCAVGRAGRRSRAGWPPRSASLEGWPPRSRCLPSWPRAGKGACQPGCRAPQTGLPPKGHLGRRLLIKTRRLRKRGRVPSVGAHGWSP